jgi:hypothetical protein
LPALTNYYLKKNFDPEKIIDKILEDCEGIVNCAIAVPKLGKILLFSNNGSLFIGKKKIIFILHLKNIFWNKLIVSIFAKLLKKF